MNTYNILIVDDEKEIADAIAIYLSNQGYNPIKADDGFEALKILEKRKIDLAIVDIMMPNMDGTRLTMKIRENNNFPIIMLSAKSEDIDKILGLNVGADDYICKPFNPLELLARVNSQLRRYTKYVNEKADASNKHKNKIFLGGLCINNETKELFIEDVLIKTTPIEFKIIYLLAKNAGKVFSMEQIYENVWNEPAYNTDTVMVHIRNIREKIEVDSKNPKYLKVVWGVGYKIEK